MTTILGQLPGEPPEPMTQEQLERVERRIRESWEGLVSIEKRELEQLVAQVKWQRERLRRVEHVLEPLVEGIRASRI